MSRKVRAIYENGVLRPLTPLEVPEHSQVEIEVRPVEPWVKNTTHRDQVRDALVAAGVSLLTSGEALGDAPAISAKRREELARLFSAGRPLSELIGEDREGR